MTRFPQYSVVRAREPASFGRENEIAVVIARRSMTSGYHDSKFSGSQQSFLTETAICMVERWKKSMGHRFVPEFNHAQESYTCQPFRYFLSYLQYHDLLRSRNHSNLGNVMKRLLSSILLWVLVRMSQ